MEWLHQNKELLTWLLIFSIFTMVFSAVLVPFLISRMSADYFLEDRNEKKRFTHIHPVLGLLGVIAKNVVGGLLILLGIFLSLPGVVGQGLLTILIGISIMDFPGKRKLELKLVSYRPIHSAIDWIRKKTNKPPLILPDEIKKKE